MLVNQGYSNKTIKSQPLGTKYREKQVYTGCMANDNQKQKQLTSKIKQV